MPITRLSLDGYGAKRAGSFAGKEESAAAEPEAAAAVSGYRFKPGYIAPRRKKKPREEPSVVEIAVAQEEVKYVAIQSSPLSFVAPSSSEIIQAVQPLVELLKNNAIRSRIVKQKIDELEEEEDIIAIVRLLQ